MKTNPKYSVMIAHGDPSAQQRISSALAATKLFQVIFTTHNGEVCIRQALRSQPDLVIADTLLAGVDGLEVLKQIKTRCGNTQVILLTTYHALAHHRAVLELADYCIVAPYSNAILAQRAVDTLHTHRNAGFSSQMVSDQTVSILAKLNAPLRMKGYPYLRDGIQMSVHDPNMLHHHTGPNGLYAQLCSRHQESYHNIERCMRSVSDHIFKYASLSVLEDYFTQANLARGRISNLTMISTLAARVTNDLNGQQELPLENAVSR